MLNLEETACDSKDKKESLCENCARNIDMQDAEKYLVWSEWTPKNIKNLKTKVHFKCDGFMKVTQ